MTMTQLALPVNVKEVGDVVVYRLEFPFLPPSKNVYDAWPPAWKHSAKQKWYRAVKNQVEQHQMPTGLSKVGLAAKLVFPTHNRRDPQNYAQALWHWLPDALVKAGVLIDDRMGCIEIGENWGIEFAYDDRPIAKQYRQKTIVTVACRIVTRDHVFGPMSLDHL
jgi:hypothetical protein